jgi:hypothetical protein
MPSKQTASISINLMLYLTMRGSRPVRVIIIFNSPNYIQNAITAGRKYRFRHG